MPRPFTPKIITANALIDGDVIYLSLKHIECVIYNLRASFTDEDLNRCGLAPRGRTTARAVGVYLVDIKLEDGVLVRHPFSRSISQNRPVKLCPRQTTARHNV